MNGRRDDQPDHHTTPNPEDDILALLHGAGLPTDRELTDEDVLRTDVAADLALSQILASERDPVRLTKTTGTEVARSPRWRIPPFVVMATAAVGAALLVVVTVTQPWKGESSDRPATRAPVASSLTPTMATFSLVSSKAGDLDGNPGGPALLQLARAAEAQPQTDDGPVQHVTLDGWYFTQDAPDSGALVPVITNRYFLPNGRLRSIEARGEPLDDAGRIGGQPAHSATTSDETYPGPTNGPDYAQGLPTDAQHLIEELIPDRAACAVLAQCLVSQLLDLHYTWVVPPKVTAAFWDALAAQPGVVFLGTTVDRLGRPAVAFSTPGDGAGRKVVIYADSASGRLLGNEEVLLQRQPDDGLPANVRAPAVMTFTALVNARRVAASTLP